VVFRNAAGLETRGFPLGRVLGTLTSLRSWLHRIRYRPSFMGVVTFAFLGVTAFSFCDRAVYYKRAQRWICWERRRVLTEELMQARTCQADTDCVVLRCPAPHECAFSINKARERPELGRELSQYLSDCRQSAWHNRCQGSGPSLCVAGLCRDPAPLCEPKIKAYYR
jgi:hypothetical protein